MHQGRCEAMQDRHGKAASLIEQDRRHTYIGSMFRAEPD
jgi:hypothetical protein